ncbi:IS110 family transposase [Haoranjiania flava]|uniref:IS110 family transposase n=1 Tax=Haoranjiania flava TaxID=1856322 RepID=A0AAE3ILR0_9BACT|nr:IS110 family transposase [Haoranjiania flava]MCU7693306.1 IS110 family transposase [Haoranjiania flava]
MENFKNIVGIDLSKKTIDLFYHPQNQHQCFSNDETGFKEMVKSFRALKIDFSQVLIVMEHTGLYSYCLECFLHQYQIKFAKVNALEIKLSMGLTRGKSDKIDAKRIALYGFEKQSKLRIQKLADKAIQRLELLQTARQQLVKQKAATLNVMKEYANIGLVKSDAIMQAQTKVLKTLETQITKLETEMQKIIQADKALKSNIDLLQSITGVGKVLSLATIIKTHNFTKFTNGRKFACYCGVAPFEHTSGTSIKGKTRVSHLADKRMKTLLDLAAKSAIQYDKELKEFYLKRVADGKSKMSTINIVRNKIIHRMFAVIKRQTIYIENYLQAA